MIMRTWVRLPSPPPVFAPSELRLANAKPEKSRRRRRAVAIKSEDCPTEAVGVDEQAYK